MSRIVQAPEAMDLVGRVFGGITPSGMSIWPLILVRDLENVSERTLRHETVHQRQQEELTWVGVMIGGASMAILAIAAPPWWVMVLPLPIMLPSALQGLIYLAFHTVGLVMFRGAKNPLKRAYRCNPFELEAYGNDEDEGYLEARSPHAWTGYISGWRERIETFRARTGSVEEE